MALTTKLCSRIQESLDGLQCVDLVECPASGRLLIDKSTLMTSSSSEGRMVSAAALNELDLYLSVRDVENVVKLERHFLQGEHLHLLYEHCARGDLLEIMQQEIRLQTAGVPPQNPLMMTCSDTGRRGVFTAILRGVQALHTAGIAHLDLSPENIFVTDCGGVKVGDLGHAQRFNLDRPSVRVSQVAKEAYAAPELLRRHEAEDARQVDAWSLGVILWTLCTKRVFVRRASTDGDRLFCRMVERGAAFALQETGLLQQVPAACLDLLAGLLEVNPTSRLSVEAALQHAWVKQDATNSKHHQSRRKSIGNMFKKKGEELMKKHNRSSRKKTRVRTASAEIALESTRGDESANGVEVNSQVSRELTLLWDLAKPMTSCTLNREGYIGFFARAAKALVLPLSTDPLAIAAAQRDWEYDLEGIGSIAESTKGTSCLDNEVMSSEQFREALMHLAEIILPVESSANLYVSFFRELRSAIAEPVVSPSIGEPELDESYSSDQGNQFMLRPLNRIPKIADKAFLQKLPPSSDALRSIRGLQPPDQREMSLKQLLISYNPRKFSLTRAFPKKKATNDNSDDVVEAKEGTSTVVEDTIATAKRLHMELVGWIGSGATPMRSRKLHLESEAQWDPEEAVTTALTEFPALRVAVVGPPGSGKTRLARVLARRLRLKYLSLDGAVQHAVDRQLRIRRLRPVLTPPRQDEEDLAGDTPLVTETLEAPEPDEKLNKENTDEDEEMDRIFRDEDLEALCAGNVLARIGVGVVLDDVYPYELSTPEAPENIIATDYLVALTALPNDLENQLRGSELAPTAGRLYSVRELAILKTTNLDELASTGFADCIVLPKKVDQEAELQEPSVAVENSDSDIMADDQEGDEAAPEETDQDDGEKVLPEELVLPPEPTLAEISEIETPTESLLSFGSIALTKLAKGFREYVSRMESELVAFRAATTACKPSYNLVAVFAVQSLNVIRDQCTSLGLSRYSSSREACVVPLLEELNDSSRAEKIKWLLYGDWTTLLEDELKSTNAIFSRLPRRDAKRRQLSKWREFCPVTSSDKALIPGAPDCAVYYSGRVYLLASPEAQRSFCSHPLQFLRRKIPVSSKYRNFWLVTTGAGEVLTSAYLEELEAELHVHTVSASELLKTSPSISMEMRLMRGQVVSPTEAATATAEVVKALLTKSNTPLGWMITDLPLTRDVAAVLLEHGCVPDAILLMDRDLAAAQEDVGTVIDAENALSELRRQLFQAEKNGAEDISQGLAGIPRVITCPLFRQPTDTLAAIERDLNPLAPRIDSIEDGHAPQLVDDYDPTVIFAAPLPEDDERERSRSLPQEGEAESEATDPEMEAQAKTARHRALQLQGECGRFCPVTWSTRGLLIPGLPTQVCCFRQKFYAFAGEAERHAFERNPSAFIPTGPCATANFVPCILLLGVRGSGRGRIAVALGQRETEPGNSTPIEFVSVDLTAATKFAERDQLLDELKPEETRLTPEEIFIRALHRELQHQQPTPEKAIAQIIAGLGPEASRIPSTTTLDMCFKLGLFPTLIVPLSISEDDVVDRLLARWTANLPVPRRKLALTRKKELGDEAKDDGNPPEEDEEEEQPIDLEAAREEETTRLREQYAEDQKALDDAIAACQARGIKVCNPVDASSAPRQMEKNVRRLLNDFMAERETLFERCEMLDLSAGEVQMMLASGELLIGKHGLACPVTGRTDSLLGDSAKTIVYRDHLYFPRSRQARRAFMACPSRYLDKASLAPRHQMTCCVVGAPLSGKTKVAQEIANGLGLVYVSPQNAVEWVMQCQGGSTLRHRLIEITEQQQNNPLSDEDLTHESICTRLRSSECQTHGWVLDGYLLQRHELQRCLPRPNVTYVDSTIQPDMLFVLERGFADAWQDNQLNIERHELRTRFARWYQYRLELLDVWTRRFGSFHVRQLDSSSNSLWHVAAQAQTFLLEQEQLVSYYSRAMASDRAARSLGVVRSREALQSRQHPVFQTFCPVELRARKFCHSRQSNRAFCADFRGFTFWLGNQQNLEQFVTSPEAFVGFLPGQTPVQRGDDPWPSQEEAESEAQSLVGRVPVSASLLSLLTVADCDFPEMKGYCPVTFAKGSGSKDWGSLRHGSVFYRASYRSKVYFFVSEEARQTFCTEPSRYTSLSLPVKLPPQVTLAKSYPGQLEQQLGAALNEVLLALGSERPKFPQMSIRASACVYLALSLKALQRRYQLKVNPDPHSARDEDEPDEEQKQRQERREEQAERDAISRRDAFVRDCRLGEQLKAALTPPHPSCGSGAKVARSMRAAQDSSSEAQQGEHENGDHEALAFEDIELLRRRFDFIVSGCEDKPPPTDLHAARMSARTKFLEYTS
ncbi:unnamed protein product [Phytophthora fragariaefolia]|uniref:Unnamed protein product n=1 Tax=Phytophthora fragariaefolia TaxID=1490495 RepID=A0A9W6TLG4_9STRA|nr:unnamed protein product [Phytophthora fragariaefolia]